MVAWAGGAIPPPGQWPMPVPTAFWSALPSRCDDLDRFRVRSMTPRLVEGAATVARGDVARFAAQQALQQGGGFGEPAGLDAAGGSQQVGAVWGLVHRKHPGWRRARVIVGA